MPNTPIDPRSSAAPLSKVSVASEITPPTTGTAPDMANFAVFRAIRSTLPETPPTVVLKRGDTGRDVARLQFLLGYIGLFY